MKVVRIRKINPISSFKVGMGIGLIVGIIAAVIFVIMSFVGGIAGHGIIGGVGSGFLSLFIGLFVGLIYVFGMGTALWLFSVIYNIISNRVGQIEIEISSI